MKNPRGTAESIREVLTGLQNPKSVFPFFLPMKIPPTAKGSSRPKIEKKMLTTLSIVGSEA